MAAIFAVATEPVDAFYDDTHYSLTYYMARSCGFTPLQAYRLASAAVSVDYAPLTRPEQYGAFLPTTTPTNFLTESAHNPRVSFHAFWDSRSPIPLDVNRKGRYLEQERRLFLLATSERNAGVLLHYVQDEEPHAGYASLRGHWGVVPGFDALWPFGAETDFLSFNQQRTMLMVQHTMDTLKSFMHTMAPRQRPSARCNLAGVLPVLNTLIAVNPVTTVSAPKINNADAAVTAAITAQADLTLYAPFENREKYTFDTVGRVQDNADSFPMYESLDTTVRGADGRSVEVSVWSAPTRALEKSYQLGCKAASGQTRFEKLPVGNLIMQTLTDGKITRTPFRLDKSGQSVQLSVAPAKKGEEQSECRKEVAKKAAPLCQSGPGDLTGKAPMNFTESERLEDEFQQASDSCDKKEEEQKRTEETNQQPEPPKGGGGVGTAVKAGILIAGATFGGLYLKSELDKIAELETYTPTTTTTNPPPTNTNSGGSMTHVGGSFTCTFNAGGVLNLCNNSNIRVNITVRMPVGTTLRLTASGAVSSSLPRTVSDPPGEVVFQNFNGFGNFDTCPAPIRQIVLFNASTAAVITSANVSIPVSCR